MNIYMDYASTSIQKPPAVMKAMAEIISSNHYGNPSRGAHQYSMNAQRVVNKVKEQILQLLNASSDTYDVLFTQNATTALNMVIKGCVKAQQHVLTSDWEHNAVLRPLYELEQSKNILLNFLESATLTGMFDYQQCDQFIRQKSPDWLILNHASNVTGNCLNLEAIKQMAYQAGVPIILDSSQTFGTVPIDFSDKIITALAFTGHKSLYGPMGIGGLVIKKDIEMYPLISGGDGLEPFAKVMPQHQEAGTLNVPGIAGLGGALECFDNKGESVAKKQLSLREKTIYFRHALEKINGLTLYGEVEEQTVGVISCNIHDIPSAVVGDILATDYNISVRTGFHCAPLIHGCLNTTSQGTLRFSIGAATTYEEIDYVINRMKELGREIR
ncbi:aminotransferase class V-fold PLP-dependent enzyme [Vagococcus zengguangii]|uniref:aminotransferase class V-fold PLP-dependent enzyme n=1 Tax=Vagococcus zengguangii TaxID=2571750 RepID=UPI001109CDB2|nr:aminotransferase class V-fold PLP-dependent enzyme [Vagococcus zengguangii]TLG81306.1 aminotransferase class V-fold PLP-dependent enzyme [Vagococcus zengguangii]